MQVYQSVSKYFYTLTLITLGFIACDDIPRDNPLDPKNPASFRPKTIAVEAFVNTNDSIPNRTINQYMLAALDQVKSQYGDKIVVAEYHRGVLLDSLSRSENDILYNKYLNGLSSDLKGVPDVFINGIAARVSGAASEENSRTRLEEAIESFLTDISEFTLEARITINNSQVTINLDIAKLGVDPAEDIIIKAILVEFIDAPFHQNVVRQILEPVAIPLLEQGEVQRLDLSPFPVKSGAERKVLIAVTSEDELDILQIIEVGLNE